MSGARVGSDWFVSAEERGSWRDGLTENVALLGLRLVGVGLAARHGWPKLKLFLSGSDQFVEVVDSLGFPAPELFAWGAMGSELVGGSLLALGLLTRWAALATATTMFVAAFFRHRFVHHVLVALGLLGVPAQTVESWGSPERALVYLAACLAVLLLGPGRFSADHLLRRKRA